MKRIIHFNIGALKGMAEKEYMVCSGVCVCVCGGGGGGGGYSTEFWGGGV